MTAEHARRIVELLESIRITVWFIEGAVFFAAAMLAMLYIRSPKK